MMLKIDLLSNLVKEVEDELEDYGALLTPAQVRSIFARFLDCFTQTTCLLDVPINSFNEGQDTDA